MKPCKVMGCLTDSTIPCRREREAPSITTHELKGGGSPALTVILTARF